MPSISTAIGNNLANASGTELGQSSGSSKNARDEFIGLLLNRTSANPQNTRDNNNAKEDSGRKDELKFVGLAAPITIYADNALPQVKALQVDSAARDNKIRNDNDSAPAPRQKEEKAASSESRNDNKTATGSGEKENAAVERKRSDSGNDKSTSKENTQDARATSPGSQDDSVEETTAAKTQDTPSQAPLESKQQDGDASVVDAAAAIAPVSTPLAAAISVLVQQTQDQLSVALAANDVAAQNNIIKSFYQRFQQLLGQDPTATVGQETLGNQVLPSIAALTTQAQALPAELTAFIASITQSITPGAAAVPTTISLPLDTALKNAASTAAASSGASIETPDASEIKNQLQQVAKTAQEKLPELSSEDTDVAARARSGLIQQLQSVAALVQPLAPTPTVNIAKTTLPQTQTAAQGALLINAIDANNSSQSSADNDQAGNQLFAGTQPTARLGSSALSADNVRDTHFSHLLHQANKTPVLEQVAVNIKTMLSDGSSKINIQLDPVELGKLEIKLHVAADGKTNVSVLADNKDTFDMLRRDSSGLERALADAGLKTDSGSLSFNFRGGQQEQANEHSLASSQYLKALPEEEEILPVNAINRSYVVNLADGLNIEI